MDYIIANKNMNIKNKKSYIHHQIIGEKVSVILKSNNSVFEPITFNIPKRIKSFRGRDDEMNKLNNLIPNTKMIVVRGCAGFGKTELVKEFVYQQRNSYNIIWLNSETKEELEKSIINLATKLKILNMDIDTTIAHVYQWFNKYPVIVVFDNAQSIKQISKFKPEGDDFICITTSNMPDWSLNVQMIQLEPLSETAALEVLHAELEGYFKVTDIDLYKKITQLICNVPLALQVIVSYIHKQLSLYSEYFNLYLYVQKLTYCNDIIIQSISAFSENSYTKSFLQAITITLNSIKNNTDEEFHLAWKILHVSVYLYADCVLYSDLLSIPYINKSTNQEIQLKKACSILDNYSLITKDDEHIKIHRIIQDVIKCYQNIIFDNEPNEYYLVCFKMLLTTNDIAISHRYSILQSDNILQTFDYCYRNFRQDILNSDFFIHLVYANSKNVLTEIFIKLKKRSSKIINYYCLLHHAVRCQHYDIMEMLLNFGAQVDKKDKNFDTPLLIAGEILDITAIKILVSHKANVNMTNKNKDTVLHRVIATTGLAVNINKTRIAEEIFQYLIHFNADVYALAANKQSLLHKAAQALQPSIIKTLVKDYKFHINILDNSQQTPLFYVCDTASTDRLRRLRTAGCLLELGAREEHVDSHGDTAAQLAFQLGLEDLAYYLNFAGNKLRDITVNPISHRLLAATGIGNIASLEEMFSKLGEFAIHEAGECCLLHEAVQSNQIKTLEFLLKQGVPVDSRNDKNQTALWISVTQLNVLAVHILVQYKADVTAVDSMGWSIIQALVVYMRFPVNIDRYTEGFNILECLVAKGADINQIGQFKENLVHWAAQSGSSELVFHLVKNYNLNVNSKDCHLQTPIYWVFNLIDENNPEERALNTTKCLIKLGAQLDITDADYYTPAEYAENKGFHKFVKLLTKNKNRTYLCWRRFTNVFSIRR